jgi:glycosyltransferase involved in cell wall biosynthesis
MPNSHSTSPPHVLLLSNYQPDKQFSMRRFTEQLADGLRQLDFSVEVFPVPTVIGKLGAKGSGIGKWIGYIDKYLLFPLILKWKLRQLPCNSIVHIIDHSNAPYSKWLQRFPHVVTCHDLLAIRCALGDIPQHEPRWTGKQQQAMILRGLKSSQCIASVSLATQQDVTRLVGAQPEWQHHIPNALNQRFIQEAHRESVETIDQLKPLLQLPNENRYIMHIGGEKWYKNRKSVLHIFATLAAKDPALHLVIVGPEFSSEALNETACTELLPRIHYFSGIEDEQLRELYRAAELLIFPSHIEGFGWPILEAQACGCAVATFRVEPMHSLNAIEELAVGEDTQDNSSLNKLATAAWVYMETPAAAKTEQRKQMKHFAVQYTNEASAKAYCELYQQQLNQGTK